MRCRHAFFGVAAENATSGQPPPVKAGHRRALKVHQFSRSAFPENLARDGIAAEIAGSGAGPRPLRRNKSMSQPAQQQNPPGTEQQMRPVPDHGEASYRGSGRLAGKAAVVTGADSGIGKAVAIAFAREGADVVISYLDEHQDAD